MIAKIDKFFTYLGKYLMIAGLVTFSLFIMEEAFQTTMFGTWPAQDAGDWILVKQDIEVMEFINNRMKTTNKYFGWIQPLGWLAYDSYGIAGDQYIKGVKAKVMAHQPEVFEGEEVEVTIIPKGWEDGWLIGGKIKVWGSADDIGRRIRVKGVLKDGKIIPVDPAHYELRNDASHF
jgi:hypothetical protein